MFAQSYSPPSLRRIHDESLICVPCFILLYSPLFSRKTQYFERILAVGLHPFDLILNLCQKRRSNLIFEHDFPRLRVNKGLYSFGFLKVTERKIYFFIRKSMKYANKMFSDFLKRASTF